MAKRSNYQDRIIRNYYQNRDTIMLQRLGELVTDLFLAEGKTKARVWKRVAEILEKLKVPKDQIQQLVRSDNPTLVANLLKKLLEEVGVSIPTRPTPLAEISRSRRWIRVSGRRDGRRSCGGRGGTGQLCRGTAPSDDRTLIRYLMRHWHTTPFEMAELKLLVRVPMDCWRQWIRHRMASINETSTRYSVAIDAAQTTPADRSRFQATANRRGARVSGCHGRCRAFGRGRGIQKHTRQVYEHRLELGVAREQARKDLPLSTYTEAFWKVDLHNLLHFLQFG